ncbi:TIGR03557 family F420-dependent LLM class oxidoreductase [Pseudonocardia alni]|uniref:G6PDH family F420-dependent oxidoreductase n=1 Tax=Pseudonocardia alni TaxID=33907 RepID=A0A852W9L5_PSEA5|nr:TIGR03557 family F420-dependent LLM class oxidoreductase [Pseudonocardia antarctica]MYW76237.1 TIGR03557 family F420-dependent LLM class oxidoreductase [Pseudonocardia sp. SID8383]NYG02556.1 G6PDH family F420-dependent oxidoreductase [Pseudonocardia antarctica]OJG06453.1 F420-dependent glucose-6-phosphate dehydrogenase [Pseudonocardia autotrophica]
MQIGFKLFAEAHTPQEMVRQAVRAEEAGFDFVEISDHYHPWLESHGHSGFAWSILAAIAMRTERIGLATGVTCPTIRYHPAIIAQAAATTALLSDGRFTLGVGSGEQLSEHITGHPWPVVGVRHAMLREALEIIRLLWSGGYRTYRGNHLSIEDAQVFDLPDTLPDIVVAAGGPKAARIAGELGDGLFATEPRTDLIDAYTAAGGTGSRWAEVPLAYAGTVDAALESAHRLFRFGPTGWKIQAELPNVRNFEAATAFVRREDMADAFGAGPDVETHVATVKGFADAGYDRLALISAGPDVEEFFSFYEGELAGRLRAL